MVNDLLKRMKILGLTSYEIDFQKIAVTRQQIKKYNLPFNPDEMTIKKMNRDSRTTGFVAKYGHLSSVEIDALPALIPDIFKHKVIQSVEQYFDRDIYAEVLSNTYPNEINRLLKERIIRLSSKL